MKYSALFILLFTLTITSCKDECDKPPEPAVNIIGSWTSIVGGNLIEFQSDGTLIDLSGSLIDNGDSNQMKSYTFTSDNSIELKTESASGSVSTELVFNNISCNEIGFSILGLTVGGYIRQE